MNYYYSQDKSFWQDKLKDIEEKKYTAKEARESYANGKLKDGEIFLITDGYEIDQGFWVVATFLSGKFVYAKYSIDDVRINVLKLKGVAAIMKTIEEGWADTRKVPWLPPRMQNIEDPSKVLWGARADNDIVAGRGEFDTEKKIVPDFDPNQV